MKKVQQDGLFRIDRHVHGYEVKVYKGTKIIKGQAKALREAANMAENDLEGLSSTFHVEPIECVCCEDHAVRICSVCGDVTCNGYDQFFRCHGCSGNVEGIHERHPSNEQLQAAGWVPD